MKIVYSMRSRTRSLPRTSRLPRARRPRADRAAGSLCDSHAAVAHRQHVTPETAALEHRRLGQILVREGGAMITSLPARLSVRRSRFGSGLLVISGAAVAIALSVAPMADARAVSGRAEDVSGGYQAAERLLRRAGDALGGADKLCRRTAADCRGSVGKPPSGGIRRCVPLSICWCRRGAMAAVSTQPDGGTPFSARGASPG